MFKRHQNFQVASLAQLVARRSHNPKVVSSILTGGRVVKSLLCVSLS